METETPAAAITQPKTILHAIAALWLWNAWTVFFGVYQSQKDSGEFQKIFTAQGMPPLDPKMILLAAVISYGLIAILMGWIILKAAAGKKWARTSLLVNFALDAVLTLPPPYANYRLLWDLPDLALQIYALYLFYTAPGNSWFTRAESHEGKRPWWA